MPCPGWSSIRDFLSLTILFVNTTKEIYMNFSIQLTAEQIAYIGRCLGEKPYHEVVSIINSIQTQVDQQIAGAQQTPEVQPKSKK